MMKLLKAVGVTVALGLSLGVAQAQYLPATTPYVPGFVYEEYRTVDYTFENGKEARDIPDYYESVKSCYEEAEKAGMDKYDMDLDTVWTTDRDRFNYCQEQFKESEEFCTNALELVFADGVSVNDKSKEAFDKKEYAFNYVSGYLPVCNYRIQKSL